MLFLVSFIFSSIFLGKCTHKKQEFLFLTFLSLPPHHPLAFFQGVGMVCIWHLSSHIPIISGKRT